ncbi:septation protein SepH [Halostreptopolyspora alba]|uniref:DUF3071 domain-containing protein n=1 Tax=Halostreptopolyspora alba TaxID=2487137 RepID=A0A3N0EAX0_9ACTN|nr:DUF3071 domain-containing protein [Nocardiopsaceae bacterium YIM 96095]
MQELRLVAVSEDGTYLVLASSGRGTRFTLPVDDRLRAAVRGQFSRLGQYEIEVENPLRPKEIQARIRSGENAEAISEYSGIPIERVRWFESPVLQEREYMAQQAQQATLRRQGETTPGPPLGEIVSDRIGAHQLETGDAVWDSWKREDNTWQLKLAFQVAGEERVAHWVYEPRRRIVTPVDDEAVRLCGPDSGEPLDLGPGSANVTPFVPRRQGGAPAEPAGGQASPVSPVPSNGPPASEAPSRPAPAEPPASSGRVSAVTSEPPAATTQHGVDATQPAREATEEVRESAPAAETVEPVVPTEPAPSQAEAPEPPAARTSVPEAPEPPGGRTPIPSAGPTKERQDQQEQQERPDQREAPVSAAAAGGAGAAAGGTQAPKRKGRGRRASVPSWDEIMFGSKKPE